MPNILHSIRNRTPFRAQVKSYAQLQPGMEVTGFVKATSKKGCFVTLGSGVDARVLLSNLSDTFVTDPAKAFPPVCARSIPRSALSLRHVVPRVSGLRALWLAA